MLSRHRLPAFQEINQFVNALVSCMVAGCYCVDIGAPLKAVRLTLGLHYLIYTFDESAQSAVAHWVENPYR